MKELKRLMIQLYEAGVVKFGEFTLKTGKRSSVYMDLRILVSHPTVLERVVNALYELIARDNLWPANPANFRLGAIPEAAVPIGVALAVTSGFPLVYPRSSAKEHGIKTPMMGEYAEGDTVLLVDDVITTGASKLEAIEVYCNVGMTVSGVLVVIDREQGGVQELAQAGYKVHSVLSLREMLEFYLKANLIDAETYERIMSELRGED